MSHSPDRRLLTFCVLCGLALGLMVAARAIAEVPRGLKKVRYPRDNQPSEAKITLGKQLYFDPRLSIDNSISCASCHDPAKGWSNDAQFATGVKNQLGGRNAPTIINVAYNRFQFWDGRAGSLEEQAVGPVQNPIEMAMPSMEVVVEKLNQIDGYRQQFQSVFGTDVTAEGVAQAIAAYERTVLSGDAPYDRFKAGDQSALTDAAQRGMTLFTGKAHCSACHVGSNFTDNAFHNVGVGMNAAEPDQGRFAVSGLAGDTGSFKTPTLREVARTGPYMHDGSMRTLEEVIDHYDKGGTANPYLDEEIYKLNLTDQEKADLITFLVEGLSSESYPMDMAPDLPK